MDIAEIIQAQSPSQPMNKRTFILSLILILAPVLTAVSQSGDPLSIRIGVASTTQYVVMRNGTSIIPDTRMVIPNIGFYADIFRGRHLSVLLGVEYQQRGMARSITAFNNWELSEDNIQFRTQYVSFPTLVKLRNKFEDVIPYVQAGLSYNLPIHPIYYNPTIDLTFGLGATIDHFLLFPFCVDARFSTDITPVRSDSWGTGYSLHSNLFDLGIGVSF